MITIHVNASKEYDVILKAGLLSEAGMRIRADLEKRRGASGVLHCRRVCVVSDETVAALYGGQNQALLSSLRHAGFETTTFVFPDGEDHKSMETVERLLDHLTEHRFSRSDLLVALGGGITGDLTGFAAAIYLRGIDFVQIPTTLLAAVDSSVGGKTGVNLPAGKNLAGAFWQPNLVLFDPAVLTTLSQPLLMDGMAEILKAGFIADNTVVYDALMVPRTGDGYAIIPGAGAEPPEGWPGSEEETFETPDLTMTDFGTVADASAAGAGDIAERTLSLYDFLCMGYQGNRPPIFDHPEEMIRLIAKAINIKRLIVEEDEWESGQRKLLNLGHTVGHAIEKCSDYQISHGSAVATGIAIIAKAGQSLGWLQEGYGDDIRTILQYFGYNLRCPYPAFALADAALNDKKARGIRIALVVPDYPGHCILKDVAFSELEDIIARGLRQD